MATQVSLLTLSVRLTYPVGCVKKSRPWEYYHGENMVKALNSSACIVQFARRAREKGVGKNRKELYLEPALVPLGEKPKV